MQVQIELIYRVELLSKRKELCNIEILNKIDKMIFSYNLDFYKKFSNQAMYMVSYVKYFRKGIIFPNRLIQSVLAIHSRHIFSYKQKYHSCNPLTELTSALQYSLSFLYWIRLTKWFFLIIWISIKNLVTKPCIWYLMLNTFEKELFFLID